MLSLPNDGRHRVVDLTPQEGRQKTLEALAAQIEALSRSNPILMIFEDVHWIDPTSLEALGRTIDRIRNLRVLLVITFRPEFKPPWIGRSDVAAITLSRLGEREITALIGRLTGNKLLPEPITKDIVERTDGIPLFVEEMTKAVLEAEGEDEARAAAAAVPRSALAVPASLHASLMARLDRVGPGKELAQIGAAIGREFSHTLLAAVTRRSGVELASALDRLLEAGLLFRQGLPPNANYVFKHALVQDAAYSTLLRESRRALHNLIADTLEKQFPEVADNQPELLARHYTEAGAIERAAGFWGKAGQRSLARSALVEAAEQLTHALRQIATLPGTGALRRQELKLQVALRQALVHLKGYAAPETKAAIERTRLLIEQTEALGEDPEDPLLLFSLLNGLWTAHIVAFNGDAASELAAEFVARASRQNVGAAVVDGHRILGTSLLMTGDIAAARAHFDRGIELPLPIDGPSITGNSADSKVVMLGFRSVALWLLGYPDAALEDASQALGRAREIAPVGTLMHTLSWTIVLRILCGQFGTADGLVDELIALADEKATLFWRAWGMMNRGWLLSLIGKPADGVPEIISGIGAWRSTGATMCVPFYSSCLAKAYAQLSRFEEARNVVDEAMTTIETTEERWFEAEIRRAAGEIALKSQDVGAEVHFELALTVARAQQAKSWELRAAMSIVRLWRDQGKRKEALELLAPIHGWFSEGFDTRDLKEAKALLDELAA
jgi:predicted ATPase